MNFVRVFFVLPFLSALSAGAQTVTLDNFNSTGATGAVITSPTTSWSLVGNVVRNTDTITVGGTARDDNGWGAIGQVINATSMTHVTVTARRDTGDGAHSLVVSLEDSQLRTHTISWTASEVAASFPIGGTPTVVSKVLGTSTIGFNFAQITGWSIGGGTPPTGLVAFKMTFDHLSLTGGAPPTPPTITIEPPDRAIGVGTGTTMSVTANANNSGTLRYQWRKAGAPITGATLATLSLADVTLSQSGLYQVEVSNDAGPSFSREAKLTVLDARPSHALAPGNTGYLAAGTVAIANTIVYGGTATQMRWSVFIPAGWSLQSETASTASTRPTPGSLGVLDPSKPDQGGMLEWVWTGFPASPVTFTYTLSVPIGTEGDRTITSLLRFGQDGAVGDILVKPEPLIVRNVLSRHSADSDGDLQISLFELTRVIELFNTRSGSVRTGAYAVATTTSEDGFAADPTRAPGMSESLSRFHSADTRGLSAGSSRDGAIDLFELTRVIELYNTRSGTVRTGQYHADISGEDGFAPGP